MKKVTSSSHDETFSNETIINCINERSRHNTTDHSERACSSNDSSAASSSDASLKQLDVSGDRPSSDINKCDSSSSSSVKNDDQGNNDDQCKSMTGKSDPCTQDARKMEKSEMIDKSFHRIKDTASDDSGEILSTQVVCKEEKEESLIRQSDQWSQSDSLVRSDIQQPQQQEQLKAYASEKNSLKLNSLDQCEKLVENQLTVSVNGFPR